MTKIKARRMIRSSKIFGSEEDSNYSKKFTTKEQLPNRPILPNVNIKAPNECSTPEQKIPQNISSPISKTNKNPEIIFKKLTNKSQHNSTFHNKQIDNIFGMHYPDISSLPVPPKFRTRCLNYPSGNSNGTKSYPKFVELLDTLYERYIGPQFDDINFSF